MFLAWNPLKWLFVDTIGGFFIGVLLFLDAMIYSLIGWVYKIILVLCQIDILSNTYEIDALVNRIRLIIGVVVLFLVAYSLLKNMINPDEALKGKTSPINFIKDVIISVVLIVLVPTIFDVAIGFQTALLERNTLGILILGSGEATAAGDSNELINNGGVNISAGVLEAFLHPNYSECEEDSSQLTGYDCSNFEITTKSFGVENNYTFDEFWSNMKQSGSLMMIVDLAQNITDGDITYYYIISTVAGVFVLFVMVTYCFEIALRVVKLAVYQLIAPLPILLRIVPNDQGKKTFSNWLKATLSTYAEVFIRLAILFFSVLLIKLVLQNFLTLFKPLVTGGASFTVALFAQMFLIVGIILFVKQAPDLLKEITGLDGGKYNVLKSAKQGIAMIGGGVVGRSPAAALRAWEETGKDGNLKSIGNQYKRWQAKNDAKLMGATTSERMSNRVRGAFGFSSTKEAADHNLEHMRDLDNAYLTAVNDTGSNILDIHGNELVGDNPQHDVTVALNEETVRRLNNAKAEYTLAKSRIQEQVRQIKDITNGNDSIKAYKGEMEKLAKDEMIKGTFKLRDENENLLTLSFTDNNGVQQSITNATQREFEAWLDANKENMSADDYSLLYKSLQDSINDHSVAAFSNLNGQDIPGGEINQDAINIKQRLQQAVNLKHVYNIDGSENHDARVDIISSTNASDISWKQIKDVKKVVEEIGRDAALVTDRRNVEASQIDERNTQIDRILNQGKEQVEEIKTREEYKQMEAAHNANKTQDSGK